MGMRKGERKRKKMGTMVRSKGMMIESDEGRVPQRIISVVYHCDFLPFSLRDIFLYS